MTKIADSRQYKHKTTKNSVSDKKGIDMTEGFKGEDRVHLHLLEERINGLTERFNRLETDVGSKFEKFEKDMSSRFDRLSNSVQQMNTDIKGTLDKFSSIFVTQEQFKPIKLIFNQIVLITLSTIVGAIIMSVLKTGTI